MRLLTSRELRKANVAPQIIKEVMKVQQRNPHLCLAPNSPVWQKCKDTIITQLQYDSNTAAGIQALEDIGTYSYAYRLATSKSILD